MNPFNSELAKYLSVPSQYYGIFNFFVVVILLVILVLKGLALWRSARRGQAIWFWIFIFVNTIGILEIIYLLIYKDRPVESEVKKSAFHFKIGRKNAMKNEAPINLVEPEIAALNDLRK